MEFEIGSVIEGTVKSITNFGAFIALPGGKTGMVHISEVANTYVNDIHEFLQEGQTVKVKILSIDPAGKIGLSIKKALPPAPRPPRPAGGSRPGGAPRQNAGSRPSAPRSSAPRPQPQPEPQDFEAKLKRFMADSDSKLASSRQYSEHRTRSRRK
jgi:S1 RNA binding domain protein